MLSRVADSIHWMSRYIERAENTARFIDVNLRLILDLPESDQEQWGPLIQILAAEEEFAERYSETTRENVIRFLTFDEKNPNSILSCLRLARENARSVREIISSEMWELLNTFYLMVRDAAASEEVIQDPQGFFDSVKISSHTFVGITDTTMSHGEGWHFCRMGRLLERADKTSRLLDVKYFILLPSLEHVGSSYDDVQWAALLRSASAFEMYRKKHGALEPRDVVEFLLLDLEFPRAVQYCLNRAEESLHFISGTPTGTFGNLAEQRLGQLRSEVAYLRAKEILTRGLHEFLDEFQTKLNKVGEAIIETFFAERPVTRLQDEEFSAPFTSAISMSQESS